VYAGLICLGKFGGQPEWVRASDVTLVGIALYVNDGTKSVSQLHPGFENPPLEKLGAQQFGHECCHFIPGCVSTYFAEHAWVGAVFCLAPEEKDMEVRDDIYTIMAYHQILREWPRHQQMRGLPMEITVEVNLVLSTNYLANLRQVCAGAVRVMLTDRGLYLANERIKDVKNRRENSEQAMNPRRQRKSLVAETYGEKLEKTLPGITTSKSPMSTRTPPPELEQGSPPVLPPQKGTPVFKAKVNMQPIANHHGGSTPPPPKREPGGRSQAIPGPPAGNP
jgi:hypothetical protein